MEVPGTQDFRGTWHIGQVRDIIFMDIKGIATSMLSSIPYLQDSGNL